MDSERGQYISQRFRQLQGRRLLPVAAVFAIDAAAEAWSLLVTGAGLPRAAGRWFFAGLVVAIAASYPIGAWYTRRFSKGPTQRARDSQLWPLALSMACLVLAIAVQEKAGLPFSLPAAVVGLLLASFGVAHYSYRRHFIAAGAVCGAVAFLRLLGVPAPIASVLFNAGIAAALTIVAEGDHRLLATTLHEIAPLQEVEVGIEVEAGV